MELPMTWLETSLLLLGVAAALAVLGPQKKRININPRPTYPKPAAPPAPPPVRNTRKTDMETMKITKIQLEEALRRWEQDARDGKTISHAEADALPVEQVASESADHLWNELMAVTAVPA
jgi:hypothetical protein